jgi:hypothetical protein
VGSTGIPALLDKVPPDGHSLVILGCLVDEASKGVASYLLGRGLISGMRHRGSLGGRGCRRSAWYHGRHVGASLGAKVDTLEGSAEGASEGASDDTGPVNRSDTSEGTAVGTSDGTTLGDTVGTPLGNTGAAIRIGTLEGTVEGHLRWRITRCFGWGVCLRVGNRVRVWNHHGHLGRYHSLARMWIIFTGSKAGRH